MRLRNHARRRATARATATERNRRDGRSRERLLPEPLAAEADQSLLNPAQEIHNRQDGIHAERRSTKRLRSSYNERNHHATRNDEHEPFESSAEEDDTPHDRSLKKRPRDSSTPGTPKASYSGLLQTVFGHEDRIDDSNWLTSTLIDLMLWRLATQYTDVHFLATDFCHLHLPSITRQAATADAYKIRDVLGRPVGATSTRPIVFVANVSHIHWNLLRVQFRPHVELQLFEPMGRLSSRSGISYRSVPRCVIEWLDTCYPQRKSWLAHSVSAITRPQQVSGFDCGVACLLYADKCGQGQAREAINESTDQHEITTFRSELQRQLERELRPSQEMHDSPSGVDE